MCFTLYKNGIHVSHGNPQIVTDAALYKEMQRAFDAGEDVERSIWNGALAALTDVVQVAIDCIYVEDKRNEVSPAS